MVKLKVGAVGVLVLTCFMCAFMCKKYCVLYLRKDLHIFPGQFKGSNDSTTKSMACENDTELSNSDEKRSNRRSPRQLMQHSNYQYNGGK